MQTQNKEFNYKDTINLEEKGIKQKVLAHLNQSTKKNTFFNWPAIKMKMLLISSKQILKKSKVKKRDVGYIKSKTISTLQILSQSKNKILICYHIYKYTLNLETIL